MINEIKEIIEQNKTELPVIANYWEVEIGEKNIQEPPHTVTSKKHNTSNYLTHSFYKTISTPIDLSYYDK